MKWKRIVLKGHTTNYVISDEGEIINLKTGNMLKKHLSDGYLRVTLHNKSDTHINVARTMLTMFRGDDGIGKVLYFNDGDVTNLKLTNIRYLSIAELYDISVDKLFSKIADNKFILKDCTEHTDECWAIIHIDKMPTKYMISNYGRIMNVITSMFIKPTSTNNGYPYFTIRCDQKSYKMNVHRCVALYFVENPNPKICTFVHHKDSNKQNFHYKNLQWVSPTGNATYASLNGEISCGEDACNAKISNDTAEKICEMLSNGFRVCEICTELSVSRNIVRHIKEGHTWKHISSKYDTSKYNNMRVSKKDIDVILDLFSQGKTYKYISDTTGISVSTLYKIKRDMSTVKSRMNKHDKNRIDVMILKLYKEDDMSIKEISNLTGMTKKYISDTISNILS